MLERIPRSQRRLVLLTAGAAVAAGLFVAVAVILATGERAVQPDEYQPFEIGAASFLGEEIATDQPLFFADPTGGTRGFVLVLHEGDFLALHVVPPGGSPDCPVDWQVAEAHLEDCHGEVYEVDELRRFRTTIDDDGIVVVDLRRRLDPPATPAS